MFSLIKFLRHEPWDQMRWWKKVISDPYDSQDPRAMSILRSVLKDIMLRRTKETRDHEGQLILQLPSKNVSLSPSSRDM